MWLKIFKKAANEKGITRKEALDEALYYGWIDGQARKLNDQVYLQKFTQRRSEVYGPKETRSILSSLQMRIG